MSEVFGSTTAGILIIVLIILVVCLLFLVMRLHLRTSRLERRYRLFMKDSDGQSIENAMAKKIRDIDRLHEQQRNNSDAVRQLRRQHDRTLTKYGIVKYDAFEDVGGRMSFALAMLDADNTGFVISSIHSRDNCYVYLKEVVRGESYIMLSDEEIDALRKAAHMGDEDIEEEETENSGNGHAAAHTVKKKDASPRPAAETATKNAARSTVKTTDKATGKTSQKSTAQTTAKTGSILKTSPDAVRKTRE